MSTPSRVTRSTSRQPERAYSSASSSSGKKSTSTKKTSSSQKKPPAVREESPVAAPSSRRKSATGGASSKKKSLHTPTKSGRGYQTTDQGASVAEELIGSKRQSDVKANGSSRRNSFSADFSSSNTAASSSSSSSRPPLVALLPHCLTYLALAGAAHFLITYDFASSRTQLAIVKELQGKSVGLIGNIQTWLALADKADFAFWVVVPIYLAAGFLIRWGTALVVGPGRDAARLAVNLSRVLSAIVFTLTLAVQYELGVGSTYESLNALFVLRFAFLFQEFLLNYRDFSTARRLYSLISLGVSGYFGFLAYALEKTDVHVSSHAIPSPALELSIFWALQIAADANDLGAMTQVWSRIGCSFMATVTHAIQAVVSYGVTPIIAFALFVRHENFFTPSTIPSASPLEASAASVLLFVLIGLTVVDTKAPKGNQAGDVTTTDKRKRS